MKLAAIKYLGILSSLVLILACFLPWVVIESRGIIVTGVEATGTNYGKPGYFHVIMVGLFLVCTLIQRIGLKRLNLLVTALNLGWAVRNYFLLTTCSGGECPVKKIGLFLALICSLLMLISALFPDMKIPDTKK
jgi:hypothetical protein